MKRGWGTIPQLFCVSVQLERFLYAIRLWMDFLPQLPLWFSFLFDFRYNRKYESITVS